MPCSSCDSFSHITITHSSVSVSSSIRSMPRAFFTSLSNCKDFVRMSASNCTTIIIEISITGMRIFRRGGSKQPYLICSLGIRFDAVSVQVFLVCLQRLPLLLGTFHTFLSVLSSKISLSNHRFGVQEIPFRSTNGWHLLLEAFEHKTSACQQQHQLIDHGVRSIRHFLSFFANEIGRAHV